MHKTRVTSKGSRRNNLKKISKIPKKTSRSDLIMASDIPKEIIKSIETIMANTDIFYAMTRKKN
jgi:hypothetical protein